MTAQQIRLDAVFQVLRAPVEALLHGFGIELGQISNSGWRNMSTCPWCLHGPKNFQCGVREIPVARGFLHLVRCMHPHDSNGGVATPHYADFLVSLGALTQDDADLIKNCGKEPSIDGPRNTEVDRRPFIGESPDVVIAPIAVMNVENNTRIRRRLQESKAAMQYLNEIRGYSLSTIERFKMGLSEPYVKDGSVVHSMALTAPLLGIDGRFYKKYVNYSIPDLTIDNREKPCRAWSPGRARAYYNGDARRKEFLFVCDGLKDLWALNQLVERSELDAAMALVSSTNGGQGVPVEWHDPEYWIRWDKVFFGHDNDKANPLTGRRAGDEHAKALAKQAGRETLRVCPPGEKDWNDWTKAGHKLSEFRELLEMAEPIELDLGLAPRGMDDGSIGRFSANLVSIVGAFHNGHFYEAVRTLVRDLDPETGESIERFDTLIIRSDRTKHRVRTMPAPRGTAEHNIVKRLYPDGTMVSGNPEPNANLTWSWDSISLWLERKDRTRSLGTILERVESHLRGCVWLPFSDDFSILACAVAASYVQQVFEAVPLILVTGAAGSGKSELGLSMKALGANSRNVLGVITAATLARFIDSTRGLVVVDDLEDIANARDSVFGDLVQTLKLSYKKATAQKMVTEIKNGKAVQRNFNFFGIKVISNTRGTDSILGTRMLTIQTREMPKGCAIQRDLAIPQEQLDELRNELHCWAFTNVGAVHETYLSIFPNKTSRQEEITAPLRVIAKLAGNPALRSSLERALERQERVRRNPDSPEALLKEALQNILRRSIEIQGEVQTWVTVTQTIYEMRNLVDENYGKEFTTSLAAIERPEWVGRQIRQVYAEDPNTLYARTNLYGKGLRAYQLSAEFISSSMTKIFADAPDMQRNLSNSNDFKAFCRGCAACPYSRACEMKSERLKVEMKKGGFKSEMQRGDH